MCEAQACQGECTGHRARRRGLMAQRNGRSLGEGRLGQRRLPRDGDSWRGYVTGEGEE